MRSCEGLINFKLYSQISAAALLNFKRLKERFEIAFAKALTSAAANDFKEHGGAVLQWLGE